MNTNQKAITLIKSLMRDLRVTEHIVFTVDGPVDSYGVLAELERPQAGEQAFRAGCAAFEGKPFANTLCKMNSTSPDMETTTDIEKVTCKICMKDRRFRSLVEQRKHKQNDAQPAPAAQREGQTDVSDPALGLVSIFLHTILDLVDAIDGFNSGHYNKLEEIDGTLSGIGSTLRASHEAEHGSMG